MVSGNLIDTAAGFDVIVGTNTAARNLNINGNTVLNSAIGNGFSTVSGAGQLLISGNMVQGASGGSIVPVYLDGSTCAYTRVSGSADYGNQYDAQISNAFLGNNRSF